MKRLIVAFLIAVSIMIFEGPDLCLRHKGGVHISCCCATNVQTFDRPPCCGSKCRNFKVLNGADFILSGRFELDAPRFTETDLKPVYASITEEPLFVDEHLSNIFIDSKPRPPDNNRWISKTILLC
jgi:hypothetical protein